MNSRIKTFICVLMLLTAQAFPQGRVSFQNTFSTRLTTNDLQGNMGFTSGVDAYRIGLYIAPAGTTDPQTFSLIGLTTNFSSSLFPQFNGQFNGNGVDGFVISNNSGQEIAFQVRAWSLFAGLSHEDALLYSGPETVYAGSSTIGYTFPGTGAAPPANLFGTLAGIGLVTGFTLTPIIPEPSTVALAVVGAGVLWCATRARRRKAFPPLRTPE
jgi:hypothetical protein